MTEVISTFLIFLATLRSVWSTDRLVTTSWGVVRGELITPGEGSDLPPVAQYLGIPYGVAPTGQFRFNMAISAAKWTHMTKDVRKLPYVCMQTQKADMSESRGFKFTSAQRFDLFHRLLPKLKHQSEDCLFMNIYVPERLDSPHRDAHLPVLVLIHGDDYSFGSGNPYNGSILASSAQIIVVTLNYRLGVFGFLGRCESSSCSGNSGISDLVSALTMLNAVLPSFGGDPKSVTLMGWGSGASLVSLLMASPLTQPGRRLFRRAILLDGTALAPNSVNNHPQQYFMQLNENLGCARHNRSSLFGNEIDDMLRCLQEHSAENVTKAAQKIEIPTFLAGFAPIVDGQLIPNKPRVSFSSEFGSLFREIDLLVGITSNPAHHLLSNEDLSHGINKEKRTKIFRTLVRNMYDYHRKELLAAVETEYTEWENPMEHPKNLRNGVLGALSDVLYTSPMVETMRLHSTENQRTESNTYMFVFAHETRAWMKEQPSSGIRGSLSADHLPYILGYPLNKGNREDKLYSGFDANDRGISKVLMHYVGNFVKSGDPNKPANMLRSHAMGDNFAAVQWPQFNEQTREAYLEISDRPRIGNFYRNDKVAFWTQLVPQLHGKNNKEEGELPIEHHLLTDHMKRDSFFGKPRPFASYLNDPFPAPPMPPSPPPENIKKTTARPPSSTPVVTPELSPVQYGGNYSSMLTVTVAVGCGLLLLNIMIFFALKRQCDRSARANKKMHLQYQACGSNNMSMPEPYNNLNSPLSLMPPPPPSIAHHPKSDDSIIFDRPLYMNGSANSHNAHTLPRQSFQEQEPLLASSSHKSSLSGAIRAGVSPTCPRHGRGVMLPSRGNSIISQQNTAPLEEIQV